MYGRIGCGRGRPHALPNLKAARQALAIVALATVLGAGGGEAATYRFTTIASPLGTPAGDTTQALAINDQGQILFSALNSTPGFNDVDVDDIYNLHTGVFTAIPDFPGALSNTTLANGISNSGQIVGQYTPPGNYYLQGFSGSTSLNTQATAFDNYTFASAVSNDGAVTGDAGSATVGLGFIYAGGAYTYFTAADPALYFTTGEGINDSKVVVGQYGLLTGGNNGSFIDIGGIVVPFAMPGVAFTGAWGVNDANTIVGETYNGGDVSGFVEQDGVFDTVNYPGAVDTVIHGINNQGDLVGLYDFGGEQGFAFVATPVPEPAAWAMMLAGFAVVGFTLRSVRDRAKQPMPEVSKSSVA